MFRTGMETALGVGWHFLRTNCLSPIQQTCTWTPPCCVRSHLGKGQRRTLRKVVRTESRQIFTTLLQKFTAGSHRHFSLLLLISLFSGSDPQKYSRAPTGVVGKDCWLGAQKTWSASWLSQLPTSDLEHVSVCTSVSPSTKQISPPALLPSQDQSEG